MPTPHDYYDIHGMPRLHNVGEGRPYLENNYHADDAGPQVPSLSTIGRGPRGEGLKVGNVVNEDGTVSFALYSDLTGELVWQSPNLDPGTLDFYPTDFRDLVAGQPAPMDIVHTRGGVTKTTTAYLPAGKRGSLVYLLGPDRIARNSDDTYQTTVGDLVIYNHYSWPNNHKPIPRVNDIVFFSYRNDEGTLENTKVIPLPPEKNPAKAVREYRGSTYAVNWDMVDEITDNTLGLIGFGFGTIEAVGTHNNEEVTPDTPVVFTARVFVPCYSELAEQDRIYNEWQRENAEDARQDAEQARQDAEAIRVENENTRIENENTRIENEETRIELYEEVLELVKEGLVNPLIVEGMWDLAPNSFPTRGAGGFGNLALYCRETAKTMYEAFSAGRKVLIHFNAEDEHDTEIIDQNDTKAIPAGSYENMPGGDNYYEVIDAYAIRLYYPKLTKVEDDDGNLKYCFIASLPNVNGMAPHFCLVTSSDTSADERPVFTPSQYDEGVRFVNTYYGSLEDRTVLLCEEDADIMYESFQRGQTVILRVHEREKASTGSSYWRILSAEYLYDTGGNESYFRFTAAYLSDDNSNKLVTSEYVAWSQQPYFYPPDDSSSSGSLLVHMHPEYIEGIPASVVQENFIPCGGTAYLLLMGNGFEPPDNPADADDVYLSLSMEYGCGITEAFVGTPEEAVAATDTIAISDWHEFRIPFELDFENPTIVFDLSLFDTASERWHLYNVEIDQTGPTVTFSSDDPVPGGNLTSVSPALKVGGLGGPFSRAAFVSDKVAADIYEAYSSGWSITFEWPDIGGDIIHSLSNIENARMVRVGGDTSVSRAYAPLYIFEATVPPLETMHSNAPHLTSHGPFVIQWNGGTIPYTNYVETSRPNDLIYFPNEEEMQ